ncbi:MAG: hypothetical protein LBC71_05420 [Oscillospiraceae bacterium]|jgi:hypothetical protein|nr:hypothetical protein [Oscillospiraceae bacterium]
MLELFKAWLNEKGTLATSSVEKYVRVINSISEWIDYDISRISSIDRFIEFRNLAYQNKMFINRDEVGNRMYSNAINHFELFILDNCK